MTDAQITQLGDDLYMIDAMMFDSPERLACYLYDTPERVLIEVGPSRSVRFLYDALSDLGIDDVATVVVTHIHLDHAGAAGHVASRFPSAKIGVHARGARHLIDPTRLWASASRVYGEHGMRDMWGPIEPVPPDRVVVLDEGDEIDLGGGRNLRVLATPGHAVHHVVFHDPEGGGMFVGDAVGICFPHGHMVQPVTPPPDLDPPELVRQLHRMAEREPSYLGFAHFGVNRDPRQALEEAEARLDEWVRFVEELPADPDGAPERLRSWVLDRYRKEGVPEAAISQYDLNTFWPMQTAGILRWLGASG